MNKVFKVIWSEVRHCYVVVSEIARGYVKRATARKKKWKLTGRELTLAVLATLASTALIWTPVAYAADDDTDVDTGTFYNNFIGVYYGDIVTDASSSENTFITKKDIRDAQLNDEGKGAASHEGAITLGRNAVAGNYTVTIGDRNAPDSKNSVYIGQSSTKATGSKTGNHQWTVTLAKQTAADNVVAIGYDAIATGTDTTTTDSEGNTTGTNNGGAVAIGYTASAADGSVALGANAKASNGNIAIGKGSDATATVTDSYVSFGNSTTQRRLTNVAAGTNDTDAVNKSQLDTAKSEAIAATTYTAGDGLTVTDKKFSANVGDGLAISDTDKKIVAKAGKNITVGSDGIALKDELINLTSATFGTNGTTVKSDGVTIGNNMTLTSGGLTISNTDAAKAVNFTTNGISAGTQQIANLASGRSSGTDDAPVYETKTNAANIGDVNSIVNSAISNQQTQVSADLAKKANADATNITGNNLTKWRSTLGGGSIEKDSAGFVTGGTIYNEVHVDKDGSYIKSANTVAGNLTALDTQVKANADGIKTNADAISTNTTNITKNKQSIADNSTKITQNTQNIATNTSNISSNSTAITNLTAQVDKLSDGAVQYDSNEDGTVNKQKITLGETGKTTTITNLAKGNVAESSTDAVNGSQLYATNQSIESLKTQVASNVYTAGDGLTVTDKKFSANVGSGLEIKDGKISAKTAGSNIQTTESGIDLNPTLTGLTSAAFGTNGTTVKSDGVTIGNNMTLTSGGLTISNTDAAKAVKFTTNGISAGTQQLANLASGRSSGTDDAPVYETKTNAANIGDVQSIVGSAKTELTQTIAGNTTNISNNSTAITNLSTRVDNLNNGAVQYDSATKDTVTLKGADGTKLTKLKDADLSDTSTDAVTGKQLYTTKQNLATEITERKSAISAEQSAREQADTALSNRIGTLSAGSYNYIDKSKNISENLAALDTQVKTNADGIKKNADNISTNTTNITQNKQSIADNSTKITQNTQNIATNTSNIATNKSSIETNASNITSNSTAITNLTTKVDKLSDGVVKYDLNTDGTVNKQKVTLGETDKPTTITNVAKGSDDTDAVNYAQLKTAQAELQSAINSAQQATTYTAGEGINIGTGEADKNVVSVKHVLANTSSNTNGWVFGGLNDSGAVSGTYSTVFGGKNNTATGEGAVVIGGTGGVAAGANSVAIGGAQTFAQDSIAIGQDSVAPAVADTAANTDRYIVSFGHKKGDTYQSYYDKEGNRLSEPTTKTYDSDLNRRLTNVADGKDIHDAVNLGQLIDYTTTDSNIDVDTTGDGTTTRIKKIVKIKTNGQVKDNDTGIVNGDTMHEELRSTTSSNYISSDKTTAANLSALDEQIGKIPEKTTTASNAKRRLLAVRRAPSAQASSGYNYIETNADVSQNLVNLDERVKADIDNTASTINNTVSSNTTKIENLTNLSNITEAGKTVIKGLSKDAVKLKAGERVAVDSQTDTDGNTTYTISADNTGTVTAGDKKLVSGDTVNTAISNAITNAVNGNTYTAGSNITVGTDRKISLNSTLTNLTSAAFGTGSTVLNSSGLTLGTDATAAKFTTSGISAGNQQIKNLAAGKDKNDAVTVGQLLNYLTKDKNIKVTETKGENGQTNREVSVVTNGQVVDDNDYIVTGDTMYHELRPTDGNYIESKNVTAKNLEALDTKLGKLSKETTTEQQTEPQVTTMSVNSLRRAPAAVTTASDDYNYLEKNVTISKNLENLDEKVKNDITGVTSQLTSNISSVQNTLQSNIDGVTNQLNTLQTNVSSQALQFSGDNYDDSDNKTVLSRSSGQRVVIVGQTDTTKAMDTELTDNNVEVLVDTSRTNDPKIKVQLVANQNLGANGSVRFGDDKDKVTILDKDGLRVRSGSGDNVVTVVDVSTNGITTSKDITTSGSITVKGSDNKNIVIDGKGVDMGGKTITRLNSGIVANDADYSQSKGNAANIGDVQTIVTSAISDKADKSYVDNQVSRLNTEIGKKADKTYVDEQVGAVNDKVTNLGKQVATIDNRVHTVEGEVDNVKSDVGSLNNRMTKTEGDVANIQDSINNLSGDMDKKLAGKANTNLDNLNDAGKQVINDMADARVQAETRLSEDKHYIKKDVSAAENLTHLDTGLQALNDDFQKTSSLIKEESDAAGGQSIHIGGSSSATTLDISHNTTNATGQTVRENRVITGVMTDMSDATSAANVAYVNEVNNQSTEQIYRDMNSAYHRTQDDISRATAGANALAALHPMEMDPEDKLQFAMGYGHYRNANAAAVGAFYSPDENTMLSVGTSFGNGDMGINAGVTFKFGTHDKSAVHSLSKMQMARVINTQSQQLAEMQQANIEKDKRIDALEAENKEIKAQLAQILARLDAAG